MKAQSSKAVQNGPGKSVIVGTAGHIDHGKTALVRALTGTDTDRLPEEKQRGITIDIGFAALRLQSPNGSILDLSLIDVPGHHAFIRNMLAGAGGIDCVMLVIAADEGVKAQTEEHLAICELLGIERGLIVLTKADAVEADRLQRTRADVMRAVQDTFLEDAPILPVSALRGTGLEELKSALARMASSVPPRSQDLIARLPLDRSFSLRGFGTIVTGTLQAGTLRVGDTLEQHPAGKTQRVRGLQVHGKNREAAEAPTRVALNLPGVEVAEIGRGHTLTPPGKLAATSVVDVELTLLPDTRALKHGSNVRVHAFTSDAMAKVLLFDAKVAQDSASGLARLHLAHPMLLLPGDRLVLRQSSPAMTIGGARVLDATRVAGLRKANVLNWLGRLRAATAEHKLALRVQRRGAEGISLSMLVRETGYTEEFLQHTLEGLVSEGQVLACGRQSKAAYWIAAEPCAEATKFVERELKRAEALSRAELRQRSGLPEPVFDLVLDRLVDARTVEVTGESVRIAGTHAGIPASKHKQIESIERIYAQAGLAAPLLSEVTRQVGVGPKEMRELMTLLLRTKRLVRMGSDDAFVHTSALERLYGDLRKHSGESFDVGWFKSFTGLTRKHAIPLLEHLDQVRVTRNANGARIVL